MPLREHHTISSGFTEPSRPCRTGVGQSRRQQQRPTDLHRLRRWPVTRAFQRAPIGVKPVATSGSTFHKDDVVQHHHAGHSPADAGSDHVLKRRNLFPHQGVNGRLDQFPCLSVALRTKDFVRIGQNARASGCSSFSHSHGDGPNGWPPGAHPVSPERQPCARPPVLYAVPVLHRP